MLDHKNKAIRSYELLVHHWIRDSNKPKIIRRKAAIRFLPLLPKICLICWLLSTAKLLLPALSLRRFEFVEKEYAVHEPDSSSFSLSSFETMASSLPRVSRRLAELRGTSNRKSKENMIISDQQPEIPAATLTVPLHATSGTHHVHVYIGSPPQRQTLIVDTGSRLMAFPCQPCRACGKHASHYFDPSKSTTDVLPKCGNCFLEDFSTCSNRDARCHITQRYTEGSSWEAYELEDLVWFGSSHQEESVEYFIDLAVPYSFGCQTTESGLFKDQYADGILGLARHKTSLVQAVYNSGSIRRSAFSLCFTRHGGNLSLGGSLAQQHLEPMQFTPLSNTGKDSMWSLTVLEVRVGDICVTCIPKGSFREPGVPNELTVFSSDKGTILDSGTTDTYLPQVIEPGFAKAWMNVTKMEYTEHNRSYQYSYEAYLRLPRISFLFAGMDNTSSGGILRFLNPESYMEDVPIDSTGKVIPWKGSIKLTNRIYLEEAYGAVLGANAMIGYDILFDIIGKRVGFARAECTASSVRG